MPYGGLVDDEGRLMGGGGLFGLLPTTLLSATATAVLQYGSWLGLGIAMNRIELNNARLRVFAIAA